MSVVPSASRGLSGLLLAVCLACSGSPAAAPDGELAIAVGALPGRPGYANVVRGVELAVARLNEQPGTRFRIALPTDSAVSAVAVAAAHRANRAVVAVVGHPESGQSLSAIPVYASEAADGAKALALVSPTASSAALTGISPWFFRVAPNDETSAREVARFASDSLRFSSAAIIYRNDPYGRDWASAFASEWRRSRGEVLIRDPYVSGQTDWSLYAAHIAKRDPDVVLFPGDANDAAEFLRALRAAGARAQFIGGDGTEALARQSEFRGARYVTFYQPDRMRSGEAKRFHEAYSRAYGEPPDMFAALSYDAAIAIGSAARSHASPTRASVRAALVTVNIDGAAGRIAFDPRTHDARSRSVALTLVGATP